MLESLPAPSHALSLALHAGVAALAFFFGVSPSSVVARRESARLLTPLLHPPLLAARGGGGGGDRSLLPSSLGRLPRPSPRPLVPPAVRLPVAAPLMVEPEILASENAVLPAVEIPSLGNPWASLGPPSGGTGERGGIGEGDRGGVGPGRGPGAGPGPGGGIGERRASRLNAPGFTAPVVFYQPEPEYAEDARKARLEGTVRLVVIVDVDGRARDMRISRPLGLGLDEKALEAVEKWRFRPATRNGKPVPVEAVIEVNFRLL